MADIQSTTTRRQQVRGWVRRKTRNLLVSIGVALTLALTVRATVAQSFYAATAAVAPEVPQGTYVLIYKLNPEYTAGQIVAYEGDDKVRLGRIVDCEDDALTIERNNEPAVRVDRKQIIGRMVAGTR